MDELQEVTLIRWIDYVILNLMLKMRTFVQKLKVGMTQEPKERQVGKAIRGPTFSIGALDRAEDDHMAKLVLVSREVV